jgi:hypothetical protein
MVEAIFRYGGMYSVCLLGAIFGPVYYVHSLLSLLYLIVAPSLLLVVVLRLCLPSRAFHSASDRYPFDILARFFQPQHLPNQPTWLGNRAFALRFQLLLEQQLFVSLLAHDIIACLLFGCPPPPPSPILACGIWRVGECPWVDGTWDEMWCCDDEKRYHEGSGKERSGHARPGMKMRRHPA